MAVVSVTENGKRPGSDNADGMRCQRTFDVITDDEADDSIAVLSDDDLPAVGDEHPNNEDALVVDRRADPVMPRGDGGYLWLVTIDYSTSYSETQAASNPIYPSRPARFNGSTTLEEVAIDYDSAGEPLKNLAGDAWFPAIKKLVPTSTFEVEVNLALADIPDAGAYEGKVNSGSFYGRAAGTMLCVGISRSGPYKEHNVEYGIARLSFAYAPETWNVRSGKKLQAGLREKKSGELKRILDKDGREITDPLPLKEDGSNVVAIKDGSTDDITWTSYTIYASTSFSGIQY